MTNYSVTIIQEYHYNVTGIQEYHYYAQDTKLWQITVSQLYRNIITTHRIQSWDKLVSQLYINIITTHSIQSCDKLVSQLYMNIITTHRIQSCDKLNCQNYTGISLLCTGYKVETNYSVTIIQEYHYYAQDTKLRQITVSQLYRNIITMHRIQNTNLGLQK